MTLDELIFELHKLQKAGYGNHKVIIPEDIHYLSVDGIDRVCYVLYRDYISIEPSKLNKPKK